MFFTLFNFILFLFFFILYINSILQASLADFYVVVFTEEINGVAKQAFDAFPLLKEHLSLVFARPHLATYDTHVSGVNIFLFFL